MRQTCINPKCRDDLVKWKPTGLYNGWERLPSEGRYLCLSCQYVAKWVIKFIIIPAFAIGGILGGIGFKILTKMGWL